MLIDVIDKAMNEIKEFENKKYNFIHGIQCLILDVNNQLTDSEKEYDFTLTFERFSYESDRKCEVYRLNIKRKDDIKILLWNVEFFDHFNFDLYIHLRPDKGHHIYIKTFEDFTKHFTDLMGDPTTWRKLDVE